MLLVSLISYIDRNTLALLAPTILEETHLSAEQYGWIIAAFSVAYTVANPVWGRWLDRIGVRWGMTGAVTLWTVASAAHALASGLFSFGAARAALGFGEGATFPGGLRTAVQTLPKEKRSRGIAVAYSGGSLGAVVTPLIVTPIAASWGWRAAFVFTGLVGLAWVVLWQFVGRRVENGTGSCEKIRGHSGLSTWDVARTQGGRRVPAIFSELPDAFSRSDNASVPFSEPRLWGYMLGYAWGALPLALVIYGAAIFLRQSMGLSQVTIGKVLWIPPLGWEIGYFFWGWLADRRPMFRELLAAAAVSSLPLALTPWVRSLPVAMGLMFLSMFAASGFIILTVGWATRVYPPGHSGLIAGLGAGAWSLMVAVAMPVFGRLFDLQRFDVGFALAAAMPALGFASWWALSRNARSPRSA